MFRWGLLVQVQIIRWLLQEDHRRRPHAIDVLRSELLPPKMEDEYMKDALRTIANPHTSFYHRLMTALFETNRVMPALPDDTTATRSSIDMLVDPLAVRVREECIGVVKRLFEKHGAIPMATPLFDQVTVPLLEEWMVDSVEEEDKSSREGDNKRDSGVGRRSQAEQSRVEQERQRRRRERAREREILHHLPSMTAKDASLCMDRMGLLSSLRYDLRVPFSRHLVKHGVPAITRYDIAKVFRGSGQSSSQGVHLLGGGGVCVVLQSIRTCAGWALAFNTVAFLFVLYFFGCCCCFLHFQVPLLPGLFFRQISTLSALPLWNRLTAAIWCVRTGAFSIFR